MKIYVIYGIFGFIVFWILLNFRVKMTSRRPGSHLKTFLEPVASFSLSMSPWRAMATPNVPKSRVLGHYVALQGHFFSPKNVPFSLKVRYSLGALPPAAIIHQK